MKIIFVGTSSFAGPSLKKLMADPECQISAVITQPDRRSGRGLKESFSPVKQIALDHELTIDQPGSINQSDSLKRLVELEPDIIVVVAYGQKIGRALRDLPRHGCVNLHASLLPKYRGAAPVTHALLHGEKETGVTVFKLVGKMDAGPVISQSALAIKEDETAGDLTDRLAELGADLLVKTLALIEKGQLSLTDQDESRATLAPKLKKTDGRIDWAGPTTALRNRIRAMQPWPGAYTFLRKPGKGLVQINIMTNELCAQKTAVSPAPGEVLKAGSDGIVVATADGALRIIRLKPAGQKILTAQEFINGWRLKIGDKFENDG